MRAAFSAIAFAGLAGLACSSCDGGGVTIRFELPDSPELSPASNQLAEITLIASRGDEILATEVREIRDRGAPIDIGNLPIGDDVVLSVELRAITQRIVGFGRSEPIAVRAGGSTEVELAVRKPFAYVGGDTGLRAFDLTLDAPFETYASEIATPAAPLAALPTSDGRDLITVGTSGGAGVAFAVSTSTHEAGEVAAQLSLPPVDAAITGDDRFLVVAHAGAQGGVSIVDVDALRRGESSVEFLALGNVGRVVMDSSSEPARAYALLDRPLDLIDDPRDQEIQCDGGAVRTICSSGLAASSVAEIAIAAGASEVTGMLALDGPVLDVAVSAGGGSLLVADTCADQVLRVDLDDDASRSVFATIEQPSAVVVFEGRVWAVGTAGLGSQDAVARVVGLDGVTADVEAEIAFEITADIVGPEDESGQEIFRHVDADDMYALDLAVVPGTEHVALLTQSRHCSTNIDILVPPLDVTANEYLLLDTKGAGVVQKVRTRCFGFEGGSVFPGWACAAVFGEDVTERSFTPLNVSTLFGAR